MTRICSNCSYENSDDYNFCAKCGQQLVENPDIPQGISAMPVDEAVYKKLIIVSYIVTIFLSWAGVAIYLLNLKASSSILSFFGVFLPFYLVQAPDKNLKKHGYILFVIAIIGIGLSFYLLFNG